MSILRRALICKNVVQSELKRMNRAAPCRRMALTVLDKERGILDIQTPVGKRLSVKYKKSGAYRFMNKYMPEILDEIMYDLIREQKNLTVQFSKDLDKDVKYMVYRMMRLKYQCLKNLPLELFHAKEEDKDIWNNFIKKLPKGENSYFSIPWIYIECYIYRKIVSFFEATDNLHHFDSFFAQKASGMTASSDFIKVIAPRMHDAERNEKWLTMLLKLNLWSNRCDLTLSDGKVVKLTGDPFDFVRQIEDHLLVSDCKRLWNFLDKMSCECDNIIIDIICDNSGYELFNDLLLSAYLLDFELAHQVRLNVKKYPWFISDVTLHDLQWALKYLTEFPDPPVAALGKKLQKYIDDKKLLVPPADAFWTYPFEFYQMKEYSPELYDHLTEATLIIFKGDLNHRKLITDVHMDHTVSFAERLGEFRPSNIVTLRSIKADVISGLPPGVSERLYKKELSWMQTGSYGIIQFATLDDC